MSRRLWVAATVCLAVFAAWAQTPGISPINPAFLDHLEQAQAKTLKTTTEQGHGLGLVPSPLDRSHLTSVPTVRLSKKAPPTYDLRTYNKVTYVQDQGNYGNCWTFGTFGSMESCLLTGESWDFSENNLANLHGFDSAYGAGGDYPMSCAYLARWSGPVKESDDPYSNGANSPSGCAVQKHVQSVWFIPDMASAADTATMKQLIMDYGALYAGFTWNDNCYNSTYYSHYNPSTNWPNHAITVIGWDDNFSSSKFRSAPPGNGAWLCKNSWGTSWGNQGYFWISYYDYWMGKGCAIFLNAESTSNYSSQWSYDYLGMCASFTPDGGTTGWGANIFSASSGGTLQAVSFYLPGAGASYEVRVYTGVSAGNPVSGNLAATKTGSKTYAGYYTVALDSAITLPAGNFSIAVKFSTPGYKYPIPIEYKINGYSSAATANAGESYFSSDGASWSEAEDNGMYFNICIKGFGTGGSPTPPPPPPPPPPAGGSVLNDYDGDGKSDIAVYDYYNGIWYAYSIASDTTGYSAWGYYGAFPAPGDYDGDGYADLVVYDYSSGYWFLNCTSAGSGYFGFGGPGFIPAPADYNGNGMTDLCVYNAYTGDWYAYSLAAGYIGSATWGYSGAYPAPGDYDGDGDADLVVYDYSSGYWFLSCTAAGSGYFGFGGPGLISAPGDYNGNGMTDLCVYNIYTGDWYGYSLASGYIGSANFGYYGALPVPGDYDGDGYADSVVYDRGYVYPGYWFVSLTGGLSGYMSFGGPQYLPVKTTAW